jgi:hypothetical protein
MKKILFLMLSISLFLVSCSNNDDAESKMLVESFTVSLDNANSIPMVMGRTETGTIEMNLYDDNSLMFTLTVNNLSATDALVAAHVHTGDVVSTGGVAIALVDGTNIAFSGNKASGTLQLTAEQTATLKGSDVYVNVHSTQSPAGLLRGQIDVAVDNAYNVMLSPANEIPAVTGRNETGTAYIRLVGTKMFYKVVVNNLDPTDAIAAGHIHNGASTVNGGVLLNLEMTNTAQLNSTKSLTLSAENVTKVKNDALYVNIHSTKVASGLLRGQIR